MADRLENIQIFKTGKWKGYDFKRRDLDEMVSAFNALPQKPPIKLGHADKQKFWNQKDGLPALGWIESLKRVGDALYANVKNVPMALSEMVRRGNFKGRSIELLMNYKAPHDGKVYPKVVRALSFLGVDWPAVNTLDELNQVLMQAELEITGDGELVEIEIFKEDSQMTEKLKQELADANTHIKSLKEDFKVFKEEAEEKVKVLEGERDELKTKLDAVHHEKREVEFKAELEGLKKEGKITPAQEENLIKFFGLLPDTVKFGEEEKSTKDIISAMLKTFPKQVEFDEKGEAIVKKPDDAGEDEKWDGMSPGMFADKKANEKIRLFSEQGKDLGYAEALDIVFSEHDGLKGEYVNPPKK